MKARLAAMEADAAKLRGEEVSIDSRFCRCRRLFIHRRRRPPPLCWFPLVHLPPRTAHSLSLSLSSFSLELKIATGRCHCCSCRRHQGREQRRKRSCGGGGGRRQPRRRRRCGSLCRRRRNSARDRGRDRRRGRRPRARRLPQRLHRLRRLLGDSGGAPGPLPGVRHGQPSHHPDGPHGPAQGLCVFGILRGGRGGERAAPGLHSAEREGDQGEPEEDQRARAEGARWRRWWGPRGQGQGREGREVFSRARPGEVSRERLLV